MIKLATDSNIAEMTGLEETPDSNHNGWLFAVVASFFAIIFIMTSLRYMGFYDLNWDLGINMQLLWTNTHGYLLYETADYQTSGIRSFLQINSAYIAIPISYLYRLFPNAFTLMIIQALVLSFSAVPIYYYSRIRVSDWRIALAIAISFLSGFAVLSGVFYDFHWESFMPLELFAFIYFSARRRYVISAVLIVIGSLTLEVFPFLAASYLLYLIVFPGEAPDAFLSLSARKKQWFSHFALLVISGLLYYVVTYVGGVMIPNIAGSSSTAVSSVHSVAYLVNFNLTPDSALNSSIYWLLLLASLGFVPLIRLKSLLAVLPWFYWSAIAFPQYYTTQFGVQYGILATSVLLIPFIEGIRAISAKAKSGGIARWYPALFGPASVIILAIIFRSTNVFVTHQYLLILSLCFAVVGGLTFALFINPLKLPRMKGIVEKLDSVGNFAFSLLLFVILVGIVIGPISPLNNTGPGTGGYSVSYSVNPSYEYMGNISETVGHNSSVLSVDNLFPFVANDPNAFSFYWYETNYSSNQYFPYTAGNLPQYMLLDQSYMFTVPHYYRQLVYNTSLYGLRSEILNSGYPGNISLYQLGYSGLTDIMRA